MKAIAKSERKWPARMLAPVGNNSTLEWRSKMGIILLVILILLLIGAVPRWPYSRNWGYWPSGGIGTILLIVLILLLLGRI